MKVRAGFVSNSSSASFIIKFESSLPRKKVEEYIRKSHVVADKQWNLDMNHNYEMKEKQFSYTIPAYKKNLKFKNKLYELTQSTAMFNDWYDIVCRNFIRAIQEDRIKDVKLLEIIKTEDSGYETNEIVEYDFRPWNYDDEEEYEEVVRMIELNNLEYLSYLKEINQFLSEEEIIKITTFLLSK